MSDPAEPSRVQLRAPPPQGEASVEGEFLLRVAGEALRLDVEVPAGPVALEALLPVFQGLADAVAGLGETKAAAAGQRVSCRAGCGACCRQPVPISEPEARAIAALVEAMPEPRRSEVRDRFDAALRRLEASGLADRLAALDADGEAIVEVALAYFNLRLACPFLEAESCSIHPDRPLACREYLVTSPALHCASPTAAEVRRIRLAGSPAHALREAGKAHTQAGWLLLTESLAFAARHPEPGPTRPGPAWVEDVIGRLGHAQPATSDQEGDGPA